MPFPTSLISPRFLWTAEITFAALSSLSLKFLVCSLRRVFVVFKYSRISSEGFCFLKASTKTRITRTIISSMVRSMIRHSSTKSRILKRKNFLPSLVLTVFLWLAAAGLVYFVDPFIFGVVPLFFLLIFFSLLFTFSLLFAGTRRGLIATISIVLFLFLSYLGIGNILNLLLIVAIAVSIELYFTLK